MALSLRDGSNNGSRKKSDGFAPPKVPRDRHQPLQPLPQQSLLWHAYLVEIFFFETVYFLRRDYYYPAND
jgi:hypothetical protein